MTKLVTRFNATQGGGVSYYLQQLYAESLIAEATSLLPHLFQFTEEHREEGLELQQEVIDFAEELNQAVNEIWKKNSGEDEGTELTEGGWSARMQEYEKQRQIDPLDKVAKPTVIKREWNPKLSSIRSQNV